MNNKIIAGVMGIVAFVSAIVGGGLIADNTQAYFCEDTNQICIGERLSQTGKTCYYIDLEGDQRGKRCLKEPYWNVYENQDLEPKSVLGEAHLCHPPPNLGCEEV